MFKLPFIIKEYRPELKGIRGLVVLLVLLFHLDFYWMEGGFLGYGIDYDKDNFGLDITTAGFQLGANFPLD